MKNKINNFGLLISGILFIAIFISSCKENTLISSKVSPTSDTAIVKSITLGCVTHNYYADTVITSQNFSGVPMYQAVGNMLDPYFGTMTASTFFQVSPSSPGYNPYGDGYVIHVGPDSLYLDSAILVLPFGGFIYGDTLNQNLTQTYQVFYMTDSLGYYSNYYSFSNKAIDLFNPLSEPYTVNTYHLQDSFLITGPDFSGLRIPLNHHFQDILRNVLGSSSTAADPATAFITAFNGICVRPVDTRQMSSSIPYFRLDGVDQYSTAGVILYYRSTASGVTDTLNQTYSYDPGGCTHFNNVTKSYSRYPVNSLYASTSSNASVIAIQNQPGPGIDIKIYGISSLPAGVINKAELQLTMLPNYNPPNPITGPDTLGPPYKLYPTGISISGPNGVYPNFTTGAGQQYLVQDRYPTTSLTPLTVMDGYLHPFPPSPATTLYNKFTIDLPREVMQAIAQKSDTIHLLINGTEDYFGAYHLVVGGGSYPDSNYRAKFIVTYSKLSY